MKQRNLVGNKYNKLLVIESCGQCKNGLHFYSKVKCDCGNTFLVRDTQLVNNKIKSCRHCGSATHKKTNTRLFNIWQSMKQRCSVYSGKNYKDYYAKGITVCEEWQNDFINFYHWAINNGYQDNLSIDRIDNKSGYNPQNCRWADAITQANNKSNNKIIMYNNKKYTLAQLSREYGIKYSLLLSRLRNNWDIERALTEKSFCGKNQYLKV